MSGLIAVRGSQAELAAIAVVISLTCLIGARFARSRVPAVSVGLVTALTVGVISFLVTSHEGSRAVPLLVLVSASVGLLGSGLLAVHLLPAQTPSRSLRHAAAVIAASAPFMGLVALLSMQHACPLYVGPGSGFCNYANQDQLGGWTAAAAIIIGLDILVIAFLVWISAAQGDERRPFTDMARVSGNFT